MSPCDQGQKIEIRCRCGAVRGVVTNASAGTVNRVTCYCDDCQAFVHHLGRADMLNEKGGSDIVQIAPATLHFTAGEDRIAGVRLSPKVAGTRPAAKRRSATR